MDVAPRLWRRRATSAPRDCQAATCECPLSRPSSRFAPKVAARDGNEALGILVPRIDTDDGRRTGEHRRPVVDVRGGLGLVEELVDPALNTLAGHRGRRIASRTETPTAAAESAPCRGDGPGVPRRGPAASAQPIAPSARRPGGGIGAATESRLDRSVHLLIGAAGTGAGTRSRDLLLGKHRVSGEITASYQADVGGFGLIGGSRRLRRHASGRRARRPEAARRPGRCGSWRCSGGRDLADRRVRARVGPAPDRRVVRRRSPSVARVRRLGPPTRAA